MAPKTTEVQLKVSSDRKSDTFEGIVDAAYFYSPWIETNTNI